MQALREGLGNLIHEDNLAKIKQQYRSIGAYDNAQKINAVKDTSLNPFLFEDPFDGLTNSLSRWAQEAPAFASKDDKTKMQVASDYYDRVLSPLYQHMKAPPLEKDLWMSQAFGQALKYDPSQSYHSGVIHGLIESLPGTIAPAARAGQFVANVLGVPVAAFADSVKHGDYSGLTGFANLYMNMHNRVPQEGFFKSLEEEGEKAPLIGEWSKFEKGIANYSSFWHDVTPNRTFTEKATSFVAENALLLPLFGGLSAANEAGIGLVKAAAQGVPVVGNLTEALSATKIGRFASHLLTSGTEGLTWGVLTRKDNDKKDAWKDALNFAAMGSLFSLIGKGGKKLIPEAAKGEEGGGKEESVEGEKLSNILPPGEERKLLEAEEQNALVRSRGEHIASPEEALHAHRAEMAANIVAGGMSAQYSIFEEALLHVAAWGQHIDTPETLDFMKRTAERDPARYKPVFSSVQLIMRYLNHFGLGYEIVRNPEEHTEAYLGLIKFLKRQSAQAANEIELHVPELKEQGAQKMTEEVMKTPAGQDEFRKEIERAAQKYRGDPKAQEKASKDAQAEMLRKRKDFIERGVEAKEVTGTVNTSEDLSKIPPRQKMDSRYEYDKEGNPTAYSMNISYDWKVAKENLAKAQGYSTKAASLDSFWQKFVDSTTGKTDDPETANKAFVEDLRTYFNPLKNAGLRFEKGSKSGGEIGGGDYTNFLGFIYHYRENLPTPVRTKVEELLMNSPKMYKILGSRPTIEKLERFGQAIQNHVDMFIRSDWYKKNGERNVFRSTQPSLKNKTKYQVDLLNNTWENDIKQASALYPGRSKAVNEAREAYKTAINAFYGQELAAIKSGDEKKLSEVMGKVRERIKKARAK
jgi:hypothetical protein